MTEREKQRLDELEVKTAYLLARQDEQDCQNEPDYRPVSVSGNASVSAYERTGY